MAEVAIRFCKETDSVGDKEFDDFLAKPNGTANGFSPETNENVVENGTDETNGTLSLNANERVKWRAKRPSSSSKFVLSRTNSDSAVGVAAPVRALKNSRKSRNGFGRGLPKKGKNI